MKRAHNNTDITTTATTSDPLRIRGGGNPYANGSSSKSNPYATAPKTAKLNPYTKPPASKNSTPSSQNNNSQSQSQSQNDPSQFPDEDEGDADFLEEELIEETKLDSALLKELSKTKQRWTRPDCPAFQPATRGINFQWLDMDMTTGPPLKSNPNPSKTSVPGSQVGPVPVVRIFGCTEEGWSIAAYVHGFTPYGLFAVPKDFENSPANLAKVREVVDERLKSLARGGRDFKICCNGVKLIDDRQSILGFKSEFNRFFQIFVSVPTFIPTLKRIMNDGVPLPGCGNMCECQPFETNVPFVLRYMIDMDISGAGWLSANKNTYTLRSSGGKKTHCQLELDIVYNELESHKSEGEWSKIAPLRVLSFDIECQGRKGYFPEAEKDPVIQIANCVSIYGEKDPAIKNVFTLKGCLPIVGTQVVCSEKEGERACERASDRAEM